MWEGGSSSPYQKPPWSGQRVMRKLHIISLKHTCIHVPTYISIHACTHIWRREWQPTPVFLPGESHGQRSLANNSLWGHKESDTTERLSHTCAHTHIHVYTYMHIHTPVNYSYKSLERFQNQIPSSPCQHFLSEFTVEGATVKHCK